MHAAVRRGCVRAYGLTRALIAAAAGVLADDHAEVGELINELLDALDRRDTDRSFDRLDMLWARLAVHIRAEHLCLFPTILGALGQHSTLSPDNAPSPEEVREAVERLRADHDFFMVELAKAANALRGFLAEGGGPPEDQFSEVRRRVVAASVRLEEHNRLEEEQVYLWPEALMSIDERAEMSARMRREIENLPPRFSTTWRVGRAFRFFVTSPGTLERSHRILLLRGKDLAA